MLLLFQPFRVSESGYKDAKPAPKATKVLVDTGALTTESPKRKPHTWAYALRRIQARRSQAN